MGIRPGVTYGTEAQVLLKAHAWVEADSLSISNETTRQYTWINWQWSSASPVFLTGSGSMTYSTLEDGRIRYIQLRTNVPFGAVVLALGMPDAGSTSSLEQVARYSDRWLFVATPVRCGRFWERDSGFYMVSPASLLGLSQSLRLQPYDNVLRQRGCTGKVTR